MYLFIGLGNPGKQYAATRHNIGFMVMDFFMKQSTPGAFLPWAVSKRHEAELSEGSIAGEKIILAKPLTFMNNSGRAVASIINYFKVPLEQVIVVFDDIATPLGSLRLRLKGSSGGQKGMQSIIDALGTQELKRLRVGILGEHRESYTLEEYVLHSFSAAEKPVIDKVAERSCEALSLVISKGFETAMNQFNS